MKKIVAVIGSPRKLGNCEIMAKEISRNITEPHELHLLRLTDFDILPCRGCYTCLFKNENCVINDEFHHAANEIVTADALIVSVPTYFLGPNSCLKRFTDRGLALYSHVETLWGKPAIGVGIAGIKGKEGYTMLGIESFLKMLFADIKERRIIFGALPGEIFMDEKNKKSAAELASALFGAPLQKTAPSCSLCGGDTFRFLGNNQVRCMLCSNAGKVTLQDGIPAFEIEKSSHPMFLTKQDALDHREWLKSMKSRFFQEKNALKKISSAYLEEGTWIKPLE